MSSIGEQSKICSMLLDLLKRIDDLEREIYERSQALDAKRETLGLSEYQVKEDALWNEYKDRLGAIVKPCCTQKLLNREYGRQFGIPTKYGYINDGYQMDFTMKSAKEAEVLLHFNVIDWSMIHKFVVKKVNRHWLVDEIYCSFESDPCDWAPSSIC